MLPRYVVQNTENNISENNPPDAAKTNEPDEIINDNNHTFIIPDSLVVIISRYYDSYKNAENQEKRFIFADSLAKAYKSVGKLDSTAKYTEVKAIENPIIENFIIAGDGYYEAFNFAVDRERSAFLAGKAQDYYNRVLEENPALLDIKAKLAMTYVTGSNPMQGIKMLQEVMNQDPKNKLAIYNLGMLSISSGQYEKALARFETLKQLDPENPEAYFYLGYCYFELGKKEDSKPFFQKVLELGISGDLVNASEEYLKRIDK
jgi:tetratricopeptide (TPR) repeat protein